MSETSKSNIGLINAEIPECVDNAITNLTDKPSKAIGNTVSDIWFLVFGGIGHLAEKCKLRYTIELEKYNSELQEKINEIPLENRVEADIQIIAPALEASKYCVEKEELRNMFVNLIASSINSDKAFRVHPIYTDIISKLSSMDALLFKTIADKDYSNDCIIFGESIERVSFSLTILEQLGLILSLSKTKKESDSNSLKKNVINNDIKLYKSIIENLTIIDFGFDTLYENIFDMLTSFLTEKKFSGTVFPHHKSVIDFFNETITLTNLGKQFKDICL